MESIVRFGRNATSNSLRGDQTPREIMSAELDHDEDLIWVDAPVSLFAHAKAAIPKALFGIPFLAFSIFWISMAWSITSGSTGLNGGFIGNLFPLFGIPFVLIGLAMVLSPVWQMFKAKKFTYALTDKRLVIREGFPHKTLKSWPLKDIGNLVRTGTADGPGDIYFAQESKRINKRGTQTVKIGFVGISDPKSLEQKIRKLVKSLK